MTCRTHDSKEERSDDVAGKSKGKRRVGRPRYKWEDNKTWIGIGNWTYSLLQSYRVWVGKPNGKRQLGRPLLKWMDIIKIDLREIQECDMAWIEVAQDRN
jgi:hypothetical protein